jgi:hypothetical protein
MEVYVIRCSFSPPLKLGRDSKVQSKMGSGPKPGTKILAPYFSFSIINNIVSSYSLLTQELFHDGDGYEGEGSLTLTEE